MAMSINTNVVSINAQRNLGLSGNSLSVSMQRLSSGLRVNSAKDDAAGLAISERMGAQMRGLKVAARNANDGISLAQTAEGALGKVGDMLQRARELAVQSSNATNSADDRKALQAEVSQLLSEVDRVAKTTSFNGRKILDGSFTGGLFQVGANAGDNITVGALQNTKIAELSEAEFGGSEQTGIQVANITGHKEAIAAGSLQMRVGTGEYVQLDAIKEASSGQERLGQVVAAINTKTADTGVTAFLEGDETAGYTVKLRSDSDEPVMMRGFNVASTGIGAEVKVGAGTAVAGTYATAVTALKNIDAISDVTVTAATGAFVVAGITSVSANTLSDATAAATQAAGLGAFNSAVGALVTQTAAGNTYEIKSTDENLAALTKARDELKAAVDLATAQQGLTNRDAVFSKLETAFASTTLSDWTAVNTALTTAGAAAGDLMTLPAALPTDKEGLKALRETALSTVDAYMSGKLGVSAAEVQDAPGLVGLSIETQAGAWEAIKKLDSAMDQVNAARGDLGALQTRFDKTVENIDIMTENVSASRGRIIDADFASETANLSRAQILQQAGTAMVAQANQLPQQVLSLLR